MGNETSSKSQNADVEPTREEKTKSTTARGRKTTPQNGSSDKGASRSKNRPGHAPKPQTALSNRSEEESVRYHENTPMGRLQRVDLYPFFKYQYRPRRGMDYRYNVKTASTVSDVYVPPNYSPAGLPVEVDESDLDDTKLTEADIYDRARSAPATLNDSYKHLLDYLCKGIEYMNQPDLIKTRVIMIWLSRQDVTSPLPGPADYETPEKGIVRLSNNTQFEYSRFLSILYEKAGIKSVEIQGVFKTISYKPDNAIDLPETSWIAVFLEGRWQLIMPYFVCTRRKHTWLSSESTNNESTKDNGEGPVFNYFYFLLNPKQSINWFYPNEPNWQLLKRALQKEEYLDLPLYRSEFFELGLTLVSKNLYNLHSEEGRVRIDILSQEELADEIYLWYDIAIVTCTGKHNTDTQKLIVHDNLQKLVAMVKQKEKWMFQMTLPIEGVYKVTIYASVNGDDFGPVVKFRLHCEKRFDKCSMFPTDPKEVGFGPGLAAKDGGLLFPSHSNGFYSVGHNSVFTVSFVLDKDVVETIEVTSILAQTEEKGVKEYNSDVSSTVDRKRGCVDVDVTIPGEGIFMLSIWTVLDNGSANQTKISKLACCYILISNPNIPPAVQTRKQRQVRENLRQALMADTLDGIESAITKCVYYHIPMEDEQVENANTRMEILRLSRDIKFSIQSQQLANIRRTLSQVDQSRYAHYFRQDIAELQKLKQSIKWKEKYV